MRYKNGPCRKWRGLIVFVPLMCSHVQQVEKSHT